jgi:two-component system heavy metal sensor histidine kinase CusS
VRHSITRRLVALFTMTTLIVVALISVALYHVLTVQMTRYQKRQVASALHDRAYQIERVDQVDRWERVDRKMAVLTPPDGGMRFWVLSDDPRFRYGTDLEALATQHATPTRMDLVWVPGRPYPFHVLARHFEANGQRPAVTLVVGIDTQPYTEARRVFQVVLGVLSVAAAVAVYALGHFVARIGLQPLQQLSDQAGELNASNLSQRLVISPLPQELAGVTGAFNGALDRLEQAYHQLEAFNADVAHELRTPLGNLIGMTQVTLARPRDASELRDVMQSNLEEFERLRSLVNDMLFLARADHGERPASLADTCVADEVGKAVEFLELEFDEAGKTVSVEGELAARAPLDTPLFRRALVNLLHNAVLYSGARAHLAVRIRVIGAGSAVAIEVINPGETIAPVHLPRLFDRFYRIDPARHSGPEQKGHGLGLAIVKAIARMHGGSAFARSADGMTAIGFSIAAVPPQPTRKPE